MTDGEIEPNVEVLKALAHASRLTILSALIDGERSVGELEAVCAIPQPAMSQQLAVLRKADLVTTRRDHKLVFYAINHARVRSLSTLLDSLAGTIAVSREDARLVARLKGGSAAAFARVC